MVFARITESLLEPVHQTNTVLNLAVTTVKLLYLSFVHFGLFCIFSFFQIRIVIQLRNLLQMYPSLKKMNRRVIVFRSNCSGIRSSTNVQLHEPIARVAYLVRFCKSGNEVSTAG